MDAWVIDKKYSDESQSEFPTSSKEESVQSQNILSMDKENVKEDQNSSERKSLRSFRIHKHVSYQDLSSESEDDCKIFTCKDEHDVSCSNKNNKCDLSRMSCSDKGFPSVCNKPTPPVSSSNTFIVNKEKKTLSSEEISVILSEPYDSSNNNQEKSRERLHSIENVVLVDNIEKNSSSSKVLIAANFYCYSCSSEFKNAEDLSFHENIHVRNTENFKLTNSQLSCEQNKVFDKFSDSNSVKSKKHGFLDSYKTHLKNQYISKPNIGDSYSSPHQRLEKSVNKSEKSSVLNKTFRCSFCNYYSTELLIFKSHQILFHSDKNVLNCEYCDYQTSSCISLSSHIRVHFELKCPHCIFRCPLKVSMKSHLGTHHKTKYECKQCVNVFHSPNKFYSNSSVQTFKRKYQCGDCNLNFGSKQSLKVHIKTHLVEKVVFKCLKCHLNFPQKYKLELHMRSHDRVFICDICNYKSMYKSNLRLHMKIHSRVSFKCKKCNSVFSKKHNLKRHMSIHTATSNCKFCPFKSNSLNELSKHICLDKLYNVQKRTLNFEKTETQDESKSKTIKKGNKKEKRQKTSLMSVSVEVSNTEETKKLVIEKELLTKNKSNTNNKKVVSTKTVKIKKKYTENKLKLPSIRRNLPSRKVKMVTKSKSESFSGDSISLCGNKQVLYKKRNGIYKITDRVKHDSLKAKKNSDITTKGENKSKKIIKTHKLSKGLTSEKTFFNNKLFPKTSFVEPVRFSNGSYIHCYYQSFSSIPAQEHVGRHIRQRTLLSCQFCNYKTNSNELLNRHTAKNHTWDPAIISILFS